jgi:hypothetical protein
MATKTWNAVGAANWSDDNSWDPINKPVAGDDVIFGSGSVQDCTIDESTASLNSFRMNTGYTGTIDTGPAITLNIDKVSLASFTGVEGTLDLGTTIMNLRGNFDISDASFTFTPGTSTLNLEGGTQTLRTNGKTLNNVDIRGTGPKLFTQNLTTDSIYANADEQITITNTITWTVGAGATITGATGILLTLRSDSEGTEWSMVAGAGVVATRVDVKDSDASGGAEVDATNGTNNDALNNTNWNFGSAGRASGHDDTVGEPRMWKTHQTPPDRERT